MAKVTLQVRMESELLEKIRNRSIDEKTSLSEWARVILEAGVHASRAAQDNAVMAKEFQVEAASAVKEADTLIKEMTQDNPSGQAISTKRLCSCGREATSMLANGRWVCEPCKQKEMVEVIKASGAPLLQPKPR